MVWPITAASYVDEALKVNESRQVMIFCGRRESRWKPIVYIFNALACICRPHAGNLILGLARFVTGSWLDPDLPVVPDSGTRPEAPIIDCRSGIANRGLPFGSSLAVVTTRPVPQVRNHLTPPSRNKAMEACAACETRAFASAGDFGF